ncbi:myosin heavy chain, embryonic smooth muscle isoform-like [Drosophila suzukii]|uniref:Myosin heavy chain, embryonic smooth muscle isoform-like n=1 Tax=Drosophila suzukii TaxID=28584 RepID=A0ABM4TXP3_DROSZ
MKVKELMERKQGPHETFSDYVSDMHNLNLKLKHKIAEDEFVELLKDNMNSHMGGLLLTYAITSLAELKREASGAPKDSLEEQTEKIESVVREAEQRMLSRLIDRLDIIAGKVKEINARVLTLEREVADLHSMRDRMGEQVETLNREVENLQAAGERLGALEARLATQFRETSSCNLRVHGVPYVDASGAPKDSLEEQTEKIESVVREAEQRMLSRLIDRLDIIAGKVKEINARVLTLEREVADLHSMRDRMGEQGETLNREVENLQAAGERLGALEARLATQFRETSSCNLRVHGVPYVDASGAPKDSLEEQTEKIESVVREAEQRMLSRLIDRLDIIAGKVKEINARVLTLEREVADLHSMRDRMGEQGETLNREVENLQAAGERLGALEARLATQFRETSSCNLRVHGVPYVDASGAPKDSLEEQTEKIESVVREAEQRMLSRLIDRLDIIAGKVKEINARVLTLEREVADLHSMRDRMGEQGETLNREVENLQAAGERLGALEARLATQFRETSSCNLRVHGVPYVDASGAPKDSLEEQTEKIESVVREAEQRMLSRLIDRLDIIAGKVKEINARVLTLEREVADLHSMRDRMGEQGETLNREVENLQAAGERLGALEARLATQFRETSSCNLRVHGVPYVDGKDLRALYHNLCFNLQLTPPPEVCDIFRARKSQKTHVDPHNYHLNDHQHNYHLNDHQHNYHLNNHFP